MTKNKHNITFMDQWGNCARCGRRGMTYQFRLCVECLKELWKEQEEILKQDPESD